MPQLIETRSRSRSGEIDLTPLVDVVFLLLIFFLVTSQFTQPTASLELPAGRPGAKPDESAIRVELTSSGELFVNGDSVDDNAFEMSLGQAMDSVGVRKIRFYGDRRNDYGSFVDLLDRARAVGIDGFSIVKSQAEDEPASNQ
ncbi:MAG: biopolymer transporter ExbD [Verrucomicrobiota bacterium]